MARFGHKPGRGKEAYLNAFPKLRRFLTQCVVCQKIGYDPERIKQKQGRYFQERIREYFHPLQLNESGVCSDCARRLAPQEHES